MKERFSAVDELLGQEAPRFYGVGSVLKMGMPDRFRFFRKAMQAVAELDPVSAGWLAKFNAESMPDTALTMLQRKIRVPIAGEKRNYPKSAEVIMAMSGFRRPEVRPEVLARLDKTGDPASHIVGQLVELIPVHATESDLQSANIGLERFLFSVHGKRLLNYVEAVVVDLTPNDIDIGRQDDVA